MKKLLIFAAGAAALASCTEGGSTYTVTGTLPDSASNGKTVYLMSVANRRVAVDSTTVDGNKFVFKGSIEGDSLRRIEGAGISQLFVLENADIAVTPESVTGTVLNDSLNALRDRAAALEEKYDGLISAIQNDSTLTNEQINDSINGVVKNFYAEYKDINKAAMAANDNSVGMYAASQLASSAEDAEEFDTYYQLMSEKIRNYAPIERAAASFKALANTAEGKPFVDFTIENGNPDGTPAKLSDYVGKGKWVLADFWASWCGPCRREIPNIKEIYDKYKGDNFEVLGIAVWDKRDDTEKAIEEEGLQWPVILDAQRIPTDLYGINGIPQIILFAPDGTIAARNLRGQAMKDKVAESLGKK